MLPLNDREEEIVRLICNGKSNAELADIFGVSKNTIAGQLRVIYPKLDSKNRAEACAKYTKLKG